MNFNPRLYIFFLLFSCFSILSAQDLYYVHFTDKEKETTFDPHAYFDSKALERRSREGIAAFDEKDLPLKPAYVAKIAQEGIEIRHQLRWFNALSISAWPDQIEKIKAFPFVKKVEGFSAVAQISEIEASLDDKKLDTLLSISHRQMNLGDLETHGLTGKGVRVAIFDTGFEGVDSHEAFSKIREENRVIKTWDFYDNDEGVFHHDDHGTQVMSCVGGSYGDKNLGAAKNAEFLLARTEHKNKEKAIEEDNWLAAVEWADKNGADLINSSLTYTSKRYKYADMDGEKTLVSQAAKIASDKGILVIVSMGNDGGNKWKYLGAPADVAEVISVGGSMPMMPARIIFSSYGPNASGLLKPDVSAPAYVVAAKGKGNYGEAAGTSFSAPLIAGFAACLIQARPTATRKEVFEQLRQTGHYFPYYDYELGYGVVDAARVFAKDSLIQNTFTVTHQSDTVFVAFNPNVMKDSLNFPDGRMLYVHLEKKGGSIDASFQEPIVNNARYFYFIKSSSFTGTLRVWFAGYLYEEKLIAEEPKKKKRKRKNG